MTELCPRCKQPQESHGSGCANLPPPPAPQDWQPCPLCGGKGLIVRFAGGGGTVAVRYVCGYCNGSGSIRTEPPTTDANHD